MEVYDVCWKDDNRNWVMMVAEAEGKNCDKYITFTYVNLLTLYLVRERAYVKGWEGEKK